MKRLKRPVLSYHWSIGGALLPLFFAAHSHGSLSHPAESPTGAAEATTPSSSPYAIPWQLRPVLAVSVARLDTAVSFHRSQSSSTSGIAAASVLTGSYRLFEDFAILARVGVIRNAPSVEGSSTTSFINPLIGVMYALPLPRNLRSSFSLGLTLPIGMGGGDSPNTDTRLANAAGILTRSAMDNALFAVNYATLIPGFDLAYLGHNWTVQMEMTLLQLIQTRGKQVDLDRLRTNLTSGLSVGYALFHSISVVGEIRYQRWLKNDTVSRSPSPALQNLSIAIGPRLNLGTKWATFRPGIAYAHGLMGPMRRDGYTSSTYRNRIIFFDLPVVF